MAYSIGVGIILGLLLGFVSIEVDKALTRLSTALATCQIENIGK